ncbi:TolC family protein [uncultured Cardiobacterium sp.]|uniref:TolC family protein n=1 Tax=uncultured Cardiobacterium sp. TaxID=417619 RepID=UPI00263293EE|nr:TolC family protein [uncultured Cardiobacterium sp.]
MHDPFRVKTVMQETLHETPRLLPEDCPAPDWQQLDFAQSIATGLCHHPETRAAYAAIEKQAAAWGETQGSYLPTLSLSYRKERSQQKTAVKSAIPAARTRQYPGRSLLELQWVLFDFGERAARSAQNRSQIKAAAAAYDRQLQQRYRTIANHYLNLDIEQRRMEIAKQNMDVTAEGKASAQTLHEEGVVIAADVSQAEVEYDAARLQYLQAERDRDNAAAALAESMGYPANTALHHAPLPDDPFSADTFADIEQLIGAAMDTHPDIKEAKAALEATKAAVQAVKKAGAPQVFLYANTQDNAHLRTGGGLSYRERENTIGLGIRWPLFEGYKRHYQEKALLAQQEQEEAALAALQSRLSLEMRQAYRQLTTAVEKQAIAEKSAASAQLNYQTRLGRYRAGVGSLNELLQAQRSLNTMRIALADATRERHQAALQLLFSVGKAFPAE